ncbi:phosphate-binding protein PstS precursor [bacterium BMS3Abin07]|nr:phosphate-binding protein PstS precursor [bacterium BMS3Abin07]GBE31747.1 phosphate-binding protein PstS precursor [bacterium BMS3Bbin05]HDL21154.1 phosphate ABC transporter substrate-binding protein PstS [Nitrospirota bacterium]HDO22056.1 phosphate ABC transporter substrate-binding protein PstS [Nitrospirota bacterium]HDZ87121.1 phosphate ABC transporter substrate-binding protein PstS [Nitrospirota bacterium]
MKRAVTIVFTIIVAMMTTIAFAGETLNGAGATFPYPVYSAWAWDYNKITGIKLNYQSIGSGGGQRQIANRTVDFGASDAPLKPGKLNKLKLYQFPAVIGGVVPVVNIPKMKAGQIRLDGEAMCGIFLGTITTWNDKIISGLNPGLKFPDKKITVVHRSDGSGTTAIFTTYLSGICSKWKDKVGAGKAVKWPTGIGGKGNEGVANYVRRVKYSIGYVEFAYAKQNKLTYTLLKNPAGTFVKPNFQSFQDAAASGKFDPKKHFYLWLTNAPGKNAWPIAGATFILLAREKRDSNINTVKFYDWAFNNGDKTAKRLVYVPLPEALKDKVRGYWKSHGIY